MPFLVLSRISTKKKHDLLTSKISSRPLNRYIQRSFIKLLLCFARFWLKLHLVFYSRFKLSLKPFNYTRFKPTLKVKLHWNSRLFFSKLSLKLNFFYTEFELALNKPGKPVKLGKTCISGHLVSEDAKLIFTETFNLA